MSDRPSGGREDPADDCRPSDGIRGPMRRRRSGRESIAGNLGDQVPGLEREAGVREQL